MIPSLIRLVIYTTLILYLAGAALYFVSFKLVNNKALKAAFILASAGSALNLAALILRTIMTARLPLSSGYEFILTFTCLTVILYLIYEVKSEVKGAGGVVMLIAAILILSVVMMMKGKFDDVSPLMPALKSPWLAVHVLTAAGAYASFALAAGLAVVQLMKSAKLVTEEKEQSIYRIVAAGFILLSLSIVLGAIWAEQAWGSYWSWDPKEVWALVTWIIYAVYLHLHRKKEWRGKKANILVIAGFVLVLFTFFGVNYLLPGLHSYAGILEDTAIKIS